MGIEDLKDIFRGLRESSLKATLQPGEFTFKVDPSDGTFLGSIVNLNGTIYETHNAGDGIGAAVRRNAENLGMKFVPANKVLPK